MRRTLGASRDEEAIGTKGSGSLSASVQVDGKDRSFKTRSSAELCPGSAIRVSIRCFGNKGKRTGRVARILAYVDPISGKFVARMGMWDVSRSTRGAEVGPQVVYESEAPVYEVDTRDE